MIKKFTLILIFAIAFSSLKTFANDDLLEVEDFSSGYQVKKIPSGQLHSLAKKPSKPASFSKSHQKQMVIKKIVRKPIIKTSAPVAPKKTTNTKIAKPKSLPGSMSASYSKVLKKAPPKYAAPAKPVNKIIQKQIAAAPIAKRKPVIVIDPGHGGKDPGAMGKLGTKEKNITLAYGLALRKELEKTGKYKVVMTRSDDRFIELGQRVKIARKVGGDVMISIHADSNPNKTTRGFSVYTLSGRRAKAEAQKLLANADREEVVRGANLRGESKDVKEAIIDFAQDSTKDVSDDFAKTVAKSLGRRIQALKKHNREGSLAVLTGSDIPSVLIELGYVSNDYEERLLKREDHKQQIVTSIRSAIDEYFTKFKMVF